jgi:HSP20 family protein
MPDMWQSFRTEMDRVFDRFGIGFGMPAWRRMFDVEPFMRWESAMMPSPAMDITEDPAAYKLTAELPGLTETDIEVMVRGDVLTLKGEKKAESERDEADVHLSERSYGAFTRSFTLPEGVDSDRILAGFTNGVLTLTLPKLAQKEPATKTIEVKVGEARAGETKPAEPKQVPPRMAA